MRAKLHRIMGSEKLRRCRLPGCDLLQTPFGFSLRFWMFWNVCTAIYLCLASFVALYNYPKAIAAKQSEKILQGYTKGWPSRVTEKYQFPSLSLPNFSMKVAPWRAICSQSPFLARLLQSMAKVHTCLPCSHMNLSVSYTAPFSSRQVKQPPCSWSRECWLQKGIIWSSSQALYRAAYPCRLDMRYCIADLFCCCER